MAGAGKATLTLALDAWKDGNVAPTRQTIDVIAPKIPLQLEPVSPRLRKSLVHPSRGSSLTGLSYSPDGKRLLAGDGREGVVQVWEAATGKELVKIAIGSGAEFHVAPDWKTLYAKRAEFRKATRIEKGGKKLYRWDIAGDVRAWDLATGKLVRTYSPTPPGGIRSLVLAPDGARFLTSELLSGEREGKPKAACTLWDVKTGRCRQLPEGLFGDLAVFAPGGRTLAIPERTEAYRVPALQLRDVNGEKKASIPIPEHGATLAYLAFSPDGKLLVGQVRDEDNGRHWLRFWDAATGRTLASHEGPKGAFFLFTDLSPDGRTLAVTTVRDNPGRLFLFDLATQKLVKTVSLGTKVPGGRIVVRTPAFSPDSKWVAVATQVLPDSVRGTAPDPQNLPQPRIHLVDVAAGEVRETLVGPQGYTISLCFSPDGKTLAAGGSGKVLLFDLTKLPGASATGRLLEVGDRAPALKVSKWLQGKEVKEFEPGKAYVVEFWATWCGWCIAMMPHTAELQAQYKDQGVTCIGFTAHDPDNTEEMVAAFVKKRGPRLGYTFAYAGDHKTYDAWMTAAGRKGLPCMFVVDRTGRIAYIGHPMFLGVVLPRVVSGKRTAKEVGDAVGKIEQEYWSIRYFPDTNAGLHELKEIETKYPSLANNPVSVRVKLSLLPKVGKIVEAKQVAEAVMARALEQDNPSALIQVAALLRNDADNKSKELQAVAVKAAEAAVRVTSGRDYHALQQLAQTYLADGDKARARECVHTAGRVADDKDARTLISLARLSSTLGDRAAARQYARKAVGAAAGVSTELKQYIEQETRKLADDK